MFLCKQHLYDPICLQNGKVMLEPGVNENSASSSSAWVDDLG